MFRRLLLACLVSTITAAPAFAHAVGVECKLRGERVEVEAYFDDDTPAGDARVTVTDAADAVVATGKTDERGLWSFARPTPGTYHVAVDAGAGHRAKQRVVVPESGDEEPQTASPAKDETAPTISTGPPREQFTRSPWPRAVAGVVIIALLGGVCWLVVQWRKGGQPPA